MVNYLRDEQNITVITNSLRVATRLCEKRIDVYCTGGKLVPEALVCVGPYSETMIESMTADLMFFPLRAYLPTEKYLIFLKAKPANGVKCFSMPASDIFYVTVASWENPFCLRFVAHRTLTV